jgi:hypothetical protein
MNRIGHKTVSSAGVFRSGLDSVRPAPDDQRGEQRRDTNEQSVQQVINKHHYLTQEEFSNSSFFNSGGGCLQSPQ